MTDFLERISKLSPKRLALLALEQHEQLQAAGASHRQPIAIVGMGCRFPGGASNPAAYWELLRSGRDAIREVPADRWDIDAYFDSDPDAPARMSVRNGGFLDVVGEFDAAFFGISPREALTMDPQQRLLLEVSWEALEQADIAPDRLGGSSSGVFVGICNSDYFQRVLQRGPEHIDAYLASGSAHSVAAGRIAYFLGLQGPAIAIDTACSSSLVALHAACASLRGGEVRMALAAGVNVMCSPETTIALSKAHMLAPDGRCKTFDASADGFSRGEGCGVLVLKRLDDAVADGDHVLAVIRGSAVNQDGRSGGLTVPNGPAQEAVIRAALADAGAQPTDVDYVEAHGTGTSLGDPIEVRALAQAFGTGRDQQRPLLIGSVKTNIGHLESAAGIAGVIKVVLALMHERIPPHLHFQNPSPHIAWQDYAVRVAAAGRSWSRNERPRLAGVSSFGFSGTNAHLILEEAPLVVPAGLVSPRSLHCLPVSARTATALAAVATRLADAIVAAPDIDLADLANALSVGRAHFDERVAILAATSREAGEALRKLGASAPLPATAFHGASVPGAKPEIVFLFTGQGSQYPGMSRTLYDGSPVFRDVIDRCDALLGPDEQGRRLKAVLWDDSGDAAAIHDTAWTQPALFAVEYGITQVWRSWGVEPAAVIGHSVGEYVAACVAGVFSLEDGLRLIAARGRLMRGLPPGGSMAAVFAPVAEVAALVAPFADRLSIAAVNARDSVVLSGAADAIDAVLEALARRELQGHRLKVSLAAHSPLVAPVLDEMERLAAQVTMQRPHLPVAWNLHGAPLPGNAAPDATYWRRHLREPVQFAAGMQSLRQQGFRVFLEVGPHPTLCALGQRSPDAGGCVFVGSLRRGQDDWQEMLGSVAQLYVQGAELDWQGITGGASRQRADLPTYPFERRSFWVPAASPVGFRIPTGTSRANPLRAIRLPTAVPLFELTLSPSLPSYLADHRVQGAVLVAGPVLLEIGLAACGQADGAVSPRSIEDFVVHAPLVLPEQGRRVQVHLDVLQGDVHSFSISSHSLDDTGEWTHHVSGRVVDRFAATGVSELRLSLQTLMQKLGSASAGDLHYARLAGLGIELGPLFRSLVETRRQDGEALATVSLPASCGGDRTVGPHPVLLDGALQTIGLAIPKSNDADELYLFTGVERIELHEPLPVSIFCHARLRESVDARPLEWRADVTLLSPEGHVLGSLQGASLRRATRQGLARALGNPESTPLFYTVEWEPAPIQAAAAPSLVAPQVWLPSLCDRFTGLAESNQVAVYQTLLPALDQLSVKHVSAALRSLGFDVTQGRSFTADEEAGRLSVVVAHRRLFFRMLQILQEEGFLGRNGASWTVLAPLGTTDPVPEYDALLTQFAGVTGELSTLRRCGPQLAQVLRGEQDPLQLLFPGGSFAEARQLYVESPYARCYNGALAEALQAAIAKLPADARIRILEIGAGTGGTTSFVLPRLPADRVDYTFTDLSPLFLERAKEQFAGYPFLSGVRLDIERDPLAQGFEAASYDIVIAANVLHATADLSRTVTHVRSLLAPQGLFLLLEGVAPERWVDLTFGLTDGWWRFDDQELRPEYPLIDRKTWLVLLQRLGFTDAATIPAGAELPRGLAQQALIIARAPSVQRRWALVGDGKGISAALAGQLRLRGDSVVLCDASNFEFDAVDEVIQLVAPGWDSDASTQVVPYLNWLSRFATLGSKSRLWLVTRGAQCAAGQLADSAPWQAMVWGAGRVFALEQPDRWGGLIDLPAEATASQVASQLLQSMTCTDGEDQVAWRTGSRYAARLVPAAAPTSASALFTADACYLITGGFGGLGLVVARWMAENGARHLALLGRHPQMDSPAIRDIEALGARVIPIAVDVGDVVALDAALYSLRANAPPLRGVVHAAAQLSAAPLTQLTTEQFVAMNRPKIDGTLALHRLTQADPLDFLVLFSSSTALLGAAGMAHYAAANQFLDAFARSTSRPGRQVLSINWGTWEVMRLASAESQQSFKESGLEPMSTAEALNALGRLLSGSSAAACVARVDWSVLKPLHEARRRRPFLSRLGAGPVAVPGTPVPGSKTELAERLRGAPTAARREVLEKFVGDEVAAVLRLDPNLPLSLDTGLFDLGMDSLMSVELKRRLERGCGRTLPSTLTFNYPSVGALAGFLERELCDEATGSAPATGVPIMPAATPGGDVPPTDDLDTLTDDELEARLLARLEQSR